MIAPADEEKGDGRSKYVEDSKKVARVVFGVHFHDFDGSKKVEGKRKDKFTGASESAEQKSIGAGFDGFGIVVESLAKFVRNEKFGASAWAEIAEETDGSESDKDAGQNPQKRIGLWMTRT